MQQYQIRTSLFKDNLKINFSYRFMTKFGARQKKYKIKQNKKLPGVEYC